MTQESIQYIKMFSSYQDKTDILNVSIFKYSLQFRETILH